MVKEKFREIVRNCINTKKTEDNSIGQHARRDLQGMFGGMVKNNYRHWE
jgi:hypothetical protein